MLNTVHLLCFIGTIRRKKITGPWLSSLHKYLTFSLLNCFELEFFHSAVRRSSGHYAPLHLLPHASKFKFGNVLMSILSPCFEFISKISGETKAKEIKLVL